MSLTHTAEHLFQGAFADEYHFLHRICPPAAEMSERVAEFLAEWKPVRQAEKLDAVELGCGTGITTHLILSARADIHLLSVDNAPAMLAQARKFLEAPEREGRVEFRETDALSALKSLPDASMDMVASAYTLHNFLYGYRHQVLAEILRVLRPGGVFVNGDRYALADPAAQLENTQNEVRGYFRIFLDEMNRPDLLEQWVIHHLSDESEEHLMRLQAALDEMAGLGYTDLSVNYSEGVNCLVSGVKPWQ